MKAYEGHRSRGEVTVTVNGEALDPRLDLRSHSPTGFEWGYAGIGPAQLALALLADHLRNDEEALEVYQQFKWAVIAKIPGRSWTLTSDEIDQALKALRPKQTAGGTG